MLVIKPQLEIIFFCDFRFSLDSGQKLSESTFSGQSFVYYSCSAFQANVRNKDGFITFRKVGSLLNRDCSRNCRFWLSLVKMGKYFYELVWDILLLWLWSRRFWGFKSLRVRYRQVVWLWSAFLILKGEIKTSELWLLFWFLLRVKSVSVIKVFFFKALRSHN